MKTFKTDQDYYNDWEYITNSQLGYLKKGREYYEMMKQGGKIDSPALRFGNLLHTLVLEPKTYQDKFVVFNPEDRPEPTKSMASKLNKAWKETVENRDGIVVNLEQYNRALAMRDKLLRHKEITDILDNSTKEVAKSWIDFNTMINCKGKADIVVNGGDMLVDLKTTSKPITDFRKSAYRYSYHRQAAFYLDGFGAKEFVFIVIETNEPHQIGIFRCSDNFIEQGREEYISLLEEFNKPKQKHNLIFDEL
jgi:hypothetical protein